MLVHDEVAQTQEWFNSPRFSEITRLYSARQVVEQRGEEVCVKCADGLRLWGRNLTNEKPPLSSNGILKPFVFRPTLSNTSAILSFISASSFQPGS